MYNRVARSGGGGGGVNVLLYTNELYILVCQAMASVVFAGVHPARPPRVRAVNSSLGALWERASACTCPRCIIPPGRGFVNMHWFPAYHVCPGSAPV